MNRIIPTLAILCIALLLSHCMPEKDIRFLIQADQVGPLKRSMALDSVELVFAKDSIVRDTTPQVLGSTRNKILIFEKGGTHLLTLTTGPDSIQPIDNVQIHDPRYQTVEGIGISSSFREIKAAYEIRKVVTSLNNVVIFVKNSDIYFTIAKDQLPGSLRYNPSLNIEVVQIPDKAQLKYIMVGW